MLKTSLDATSFSARLTELRKDKKLSQKQVAKDLGISQSLLSHYENGIRECGLSFVVKVAKYYGVSCDYLLGATNNTLSLDQGTITDILEDKEMSFSTIIRAGISAANKIAKEQELLDYAIKVYGISTFFILFAGAKKGVLPISWIGSNPLNPDTVAYLSNTLSKELYEMKAGTRRQIKENVPDCISTVASWTNDYLNVSIASLIL
ncbi:MAG: helix-turn-helix transcriptional regulator [Ruminococcaceae bacterium]|nr:helix-turn-helix transcriptional regulator [Oscillospiraceae bacterium]